MKTTIDDPAFPLITYRRGSTGIPTPIVRGTGFRVETIVVSHHRWGQSIQELAEEFTIPIEAVRAAMDYYETHRQEMDTLIRIEQEIEAGLRISG